MAETGRKKGSFSTNLGFTLLNQTNSTMTKEEVSASLERMEDDPDDWCEARFYNRSRDWLTAMLKGTREFSALGVLVCNNKIWVVCHGADEYCQRSN